MLGQSQVIFCYPQDIRSFVQAARESNQNARNRGEKIELTKNKAAPDGGAAERELSAFTCGPYALDASRSARGVRTSFRQVLLPRPQRSDFQKQRRS